MSSDTVPVTQADERRRWLVDRLHYAIQFHIWADATRAEVAEVVDSLDEGDSFDDHVAALVQMPKGIYQGQVQDAVDATFSCHPATPTPSSAMPSREEIARTIFERQYPYGTSWDDWAAYTEKNPGGFDGRNSSREIADAILALTSVDRAGQGFVDCGDCGGSGCRVEPGCCGNCEWECGGRGCSGPIPVQEQCRTCGGAGQFPADPPALSSIGSEAE